MRPVALAILMLGVAGSTAHAHPVRVVTSIETFAWLARTVGGDRVEVESLSGGLQDPHVIEPKPGLLVALSKADLLVSAGLDLEAGWLPALVAKSRNERIQPGAPGNLDASTAVPVLDALDEPAKGLRATVHPRGNPHYWIPPQNALKVARAIVERLKDIDPSGAPSFDRNLGTFSTLLERNAGRWNAQAAALQGRKIVTFHQSWSYVSRWLGLVEVGYIEDKPGIPPDARHLAELVQTMKAQAVRTILVEPYYNLSIVSMVARKAGAKPLAVPSDIGTSHALGGTTHRIATYPELVDTVLAMLQSA